MNTFEQPERVCAQPFEKVDLVAGEARLDLPPLSVLALTLEIG